MGAGFTSWLFCSSGAVTCLARAGIMMLDYAEAACRRHAKGKPASSGLYRQVGGPVRTHDASGLRLLGAWTGGWADVINLLGKKPALGVGSGTPRALPQRDDPKSFHFTTWVRASSAEDMQMRLLSAALCRQCGQRASSLRIRRSSPAAGAWPRLVRFNSSSGEHESRDVSEHTINDKIILR